MSNSKKSTIKLPRLKTKDELLKTSPELFNKLLLGEDMSSARSAAPQAKTQPPAGHSTVSRPGSQRGGQLANYDTPRGFGDEPLTIDQELAIELESVKRERQQLLDSIAQVKAESGTAGGEAQQADIRQLLKELELKKAKLNELKGESRKTESSIAKMRDDDTDAQRLTPDDCAEESAYIQSLRDEMNQVEEDLLEADAKNRLYYLLGERTRREHMSIDQKVRDKQESKRACLEDLANLSEHYNVTRAAKELAEKELAKTKRQVEEARADWMRKIRERRAEVRELKKRQQKEREKEVKRREKQLEKEKAERAAQAKLKMEQEAYQLQVAALAPKIEAMEASWNRLRAISGAETPNEVVEYWQGLKAKEQHMRDLVALAEQREAGCKAEISQLLASRSAMFESSKAAAAVAAAAAAAAAAALEAARAAGAGPYSAEEDLEAVNARIEAAEKRMDTAQVQFGKLRSICVAAEQGLRSLMHRLQLALEEVPPPAAVAGVSPHVAHHSPTASVGQSGQLNAIGPGQAGAGSRLQSAGASSNAGSHAEAMRRSAGGAGSNRQGRTTKELMDSTLTSKANRLNSTRARDARSAGTGSDFSAANLALVPEDASAALLRSGQSGPVSGLQLAGLASGPASAAATSRPMLPSRGKNTIEDDNFFEGLPQLLAEVTEKLEKLLVAGEGLDYAAIRAAAVAAAEGSLRSGSAASTAPGSVNPTPRVAGDAAAAAAGATPAPPPAIVETQEQKASNQAEEGQAAMHETVTPAEGEGLTAEAEGEESGTVEGEEGGAADSNAEESPAGDAPALEGVIDQAADGEAEAETAGGADKQEEQSGAGDDASATEQAGEQAGAAIDVELNAAEQQKAEGAPAVGQQKQQLSPAAVAAPETSGDGTAAGSSTSATAPSSNSGAAGSNSVSAPATVRLSASVPAAALAVGGTMHTMLPDSEKALLKGLPRRTWTGAPWLDSVGDNPLDMSLVASMKRKKGKKKEAAPAPDLSRILGYTPPSDVPAESDSDDDAAADAEAGADGVVDREWIKMRAAKMMARHNAKQAAAAAAAQQGSGR